jgi:hypothetical protein
VDRFALGKIIPRGRATVLSGFAFLVVATGALRKGEVDFYPLLTLTPARKAEFHPSQPWWENETALISLEATPIERPTATAGKRIAIRGMPILKTLAESLFPGSPLVIIPEIRVNRCTWSFATCPFMIDTSCSLQISRIKSRTRVPTSPDSAGRRYFVIHTRCR